MLPFSQHLQACVEQGIYLEHSSEPFQFDCQLNPNEGFRLSPKATKMFQIVQLHGHMRSTDIPFPAIIGFQLLFVVP